MKLPEPVDTTWSQYADNYDYVTVVCMHVTIHKYSVRQAVTAPTYIMSKVQAKEALLQWFWRRLGAA